MEAQFKLKRHSNSAGKLPGVSNHVGLNAAGAQVKAFLCFLRLALSGIAVNSILTLRQVLSMESRT